MYKGYSALEVKFIVQEPFTVPAFHSHTYVKYTIYSKEIQLIMIITAGSR